MARLSLGSNLILLLLKLGVGIMSGSVSVLSEAAHSASDLIASALTLFSVRLVDLPPDEPHPYGHGKVEGISTLAQGALLAGVACYIIYEAIHSAWSLAREAVALLMDTPLPRAEVEAVQSILLEDSLPLVKAHELTEEVEDQIRHALPQTEVTLHAEPFHAEISHQQEAHGRSLSQTPTEK